jgi:uncharacterized repeat protein (TIGR01451 family)
MIRLGAVGLLRGLWTLMLVLLVLTGCQSANESEENPSAGFSRLILHTTSADPTRGSLQRAAAAAETRQEGEPERLRVEVTAADIDPAIVVDCPLPGPPPDDGFTGEITGSCTITGTPEAIVTVQENTATNISIEVAILIPDGVDRQVTVTVLDASGEEVVSQGQTTTNVPTSGSAVEVVLFSETDLRLVKSDAPDPIAAGNNLIYTLTVTNDGPIDATGVTVTDTLPAGVIFQTTGSSPSCSGVNGTVTCSIGAVANQAQAQAIIAVAVNADAASPLSNTATVAGNQTDSVPGNNSSTTTTTVEAVVQQADLAVTKIDAPDPVSAGQQLTYTITVTNNGPDNATGVTLTDMLPAGTTLVSTTPAAPTCNSVSGTVTCDLGTLASASAEVTIVVAVPLSATGMLSNTASVTANQADPNLGDNSSTTTTTVEAVVQPADLAVSKNDTPDPVIAGQTLVYSVLVTNNGPGNASGVQIRDTLPAGVTFDGDHSSNGCAIDSGQVACSVGLLAAGANTMVTIAAIVAPGTMGPLMNTASVQGNEADNDPENDSATATTTVTQAADLAVSKVDSPDPIAAGQQLTYTVTVTNTGPSDASGVTVTDPLPTGVTFDGETSSSACSLNSGTVTCAVGALANQAQAQVTIVVTVNADAASPLSNTVSVTGDQADPGAGNDSATVQTTVNAEVNLAIAKVANLEEVVAGNPLTYTITVTNTGPSNASGVTVTDMLPAGTTFDDELSSDACTATSGTVTCTLGNLPAMPGSNVAMATIAVTVSPGATSALVNTAAVASDQSAAVASEPLTTTVSQQADLAVSKVDSPDPIAAGQQLTYTVTVTNTGPSDASGVTVTDPLPTGVTFDGETSSPVCSLNSGAVTCAVGALAAGADVVITIAGDVASGTTGPLTNTVTVQGNEADPASANDSSTAQTTVTQLQADLAITKTDTPDPVQIGAMLTHTLHVTNNGPSDATDVTVVDVSAPGFMLNSVIPSQGECTALQCNLGTLAVDGNATVTIEGVVRGADSSTGFTLQLLGSPDTPTILLTNTSASERIAEFSLTIGDTTREYESVSNIISPGVSSTLFLPDTSSSGISSDEVLFRFAGFDPGESFQFHANIDRDNSNTNENYQMVLFDLDGSNADDNAVVTVTFANGTTLSGHLPDFASNPSNVFTFPLVTPTTGPLTNIAQVIGHETDPDVSNNIAIAETTVELSSGITGRVTDDDTSAPVANLTVQAYAFDSGALIGETPTAADGTYALSLPVGMYNVVALGTGTLATQWSGGAANFNAAAPVTVGSVTDGVDFALAAGGAISGRVTNLSMAPVAGIRVQFFDAVTNLLVATARTDASGEYSRGLAPGQYKVRFNGGSSGLGTVYFPAATIRNAAEPIEVTSSSSTTADVQLVQGGRLLGRVTDAATGAPVNDAWIIVNDASRGFVTATRTGGAGTYVVSLASGNYRVWVRPAGTTLATQFHNPVGGMQNFTASTPVAVIAGSDVPGIDFALDEGVVLTGQVVSTASGMPLAGVEIRAKAFDNFGFVTNAHTRSDGTYALNLPPGDYKIQARTRGSDYATMYFDGINERDRATTVRAETGSTPPQVDFDLPRGGTISGQVTSGGVGVPFVQVCFTDLSTGFLDCVRSQFDGSYRATVKAPRSYAVFPSTGTPSFVNLARDDRDSTKRHQVSVAPGSETANVDFDLAADAKISGAVTAAADDRPLPRAVVQAFDAETGAFVASARADFDGNYMIALPFGSYKLKVTPEGHALPWQWFSTGSGSVYGRSSASPVNVSSGAEAIADISIADGGSIAGSVTSADGGGPVSEAQVQIAMLPTFGDGIVAGALASYSVRADGTYTAFGPPGLFAVEAQPSNDTPFTRQFFENAASLDGADTVQIISTGIETHDINFVLNADLAPRSIAVTSDGNSAYVSNFGASSVSLIDLTASAPAQRLVQRIPVGEAPSDVAVVPNPGEVWVSNRSSATISVIDPATNTVVDTIPTAPEPNAIAFTSSGAMAYVAHVAGQVVSVISTGTNSVLTTIALGTPGGRIAISFDDQRVLVTNPNADIVTVIRTSDNTVIDTVTVGDRPTGIATLPGQPFAYVANRDDNTVSVIDLSSNTVVKTIPVGNAPRDIAARPNGAQVLVANTGSRTVSVIDTSTNTVVATVPVGDEPRGIAFSPNPDEAYTVNSADNTITVINLSTPDPFTVLDTFGLGIDSDGDGMPDSFEREHGLDPNNASDAANDPDDDGLSNLEEFQRGTDPNLPDTDFDLLPDGAEISAGTDPRNPDTDGDGLADGAETNTGEFVNPNDTGTDPLDPDSDDDGLLDGVETNTDTFVSADNTGTDPLDPDTDGDGASDGTEVFVMINPNSADEHLPALFDNFDGIDPNGINRAKWNERDIFRFVEDDETISGDEVLVSGLRQFGSDRPNTLNFLNTNAVTAFQADVTVNAVSSTNAIPTARLAGDFYNSSQLPVHPGGRFGEVFAESGIRQGGMTGSVVVVIARCEDPSCATSTTLFFDNTTFGTVPPGSRRTLSIAFDGSTFTFGCDDGSGDCSGHSTITFDPTPMAPNTGPPQFPFKGIGTRVRGIDGPDEGGAILARFDNVLADTGSGLMSYDDFSIGVIDPTKWANLGIARGDATIIIDETTAMGQLALGIEALGADDRANLTFANPGAVSSYAADLRVDDVVTEMGMATPRAGLTSFFYSDGMGDVFANFDLVYNGSDFDIEVFVGRCDSSDCSAITPLFSDQETFGSVALDQTVRLSIEFDADGSVPSFTFGCMLPSSEPVYCNSDAPEIVFDPTSSTPPPPVSGPPRTPFKGFVTQVSDVQNSDEGGHILITLDNVDVLR